jgi:uncharacterized membrane protein HdeD (DUF308 family)
MSFSRQRIGSFLILIGLILLVIFFASDQSQDPQFGLFFGGTVLTILGGFMFWHFRPPPTPSGRFRLFRKMSERSRTKKEKKKK